MLGLWVAFDGELAKASPNDPATTTTREKWLLPLFQELGYGDCRPPKRLSSMAKTYPVSHSLGVVPIHLVVRMSLWTAGLGVLRAPRLSLPMDWCRNCLNRSSERLWAS